MHTHDKAESDRAFPHRLVLEHGMAYELAALVKMWRDDLAYGNEHLLNISLRAMRPRHLADLRGGDNRAFGGMAYMEARSASLAEGGVEGKYRIAKHDRDTSPVGARASRLETILIQTHI